MLSKIIYIINDKLPVFDFFQTKSVHNVHNSVDNLKTSLSEVHIRESQ